MSSFFARVAPAKQADHRDQYEAEFDKDLAAIEPVDGVTLQGGIGKQAVKENSSSSEIDAEMERLPQMAAEPQPQIRGNHNEGKEIERNSANGVFERLAGRVHRTDEIEQAKPRVFIEK